MNSARGEAVFSIGGEDHALCLTLGALAEIETALGCADLGELEARLKRLSAADLLTILTALLRGGGLTGDVQDIAVHKIDLSAAASAVGEAFSSAFR